MMGLKESSEDGIGWKKSLDMGAGGNKAEHLQPIK